MTVSDDIGWGLLCPDVEEWRDTEYPGYRVSSHGRVIGPDGLLNQRLANKSGYPVVSIRVARPRTRTVHRLVALAFLGPPPTPKHEVCHGDKGSSSNHVGNLRWDTHKENCRDTVRHGMSLEGERNPQAKLTWKEVREIRDLYAARVFLQRELGKIYGVSQGVVSAVIREEAWIG
jgi:hypothetical protein